MIDCQARAYQSCRSLGCENKSEIQQLNDHKKTNWHLHVLWTTLQNSAELRWLNRHARCKIQDRYGVSAKLCLFNLELWASFAGCPWVNEYDYFKRLALHVRYLQIIICGRPTGTSEIHIFAFFALHYTNLLTLITSFLKQLWGGKHHINKRPRCWS